MNKSEPVRVNSQNVACFTGNLGHDPEWMVSKNGRGFAKFSVAVNSPRHDDPMWLSCAYFGTLAEAFSEKAKKGDLVAVAGELWVGTFQRQNGTTGVSVDLLVSTAQVLAQNLPPGKPKAAPKEPTDEEILDEVMGSGRRPF